MGVIIKQSFWGTAISYIGVMVGYLNTLYLRPLYFDLDQIGLFQLITANAMMISPLATLGLGSSYIRFFPKFEEVNRNQLFTLFTLITGLGSLVILFIGILLKGLIVNYYANEAPEYIQYLGVTAIVMVVNTFFELFYSYTRSILRVILPSVLRDIFLRIGMITLVIGFAVQWLTFDQAVMGIGFIYIMALGILMWSCFRSHQLKFSYNFSFLDHTWVKAIFAYSIYAMLLAGSFAIINNSSYNQITSILGSSATGIFTVCFFIGVIVEMPRRNMVKIVQPIISSASEKRDITLIKSIYQKGSITMLTLGALLFIGIITNIGDLFDFIPKGEEFRVGKGVVIAVCAAKLGLMASGFPGEIISFSPHYKFNLFFQLIAAGILVVLNQLLLPLYGLNGVAIAYLITILSLTYSRVAYVYFKFKLHPFLIDHVKLGAISLVTGLMAYYLDIDIHPILMIILRSILTLIVFTFLIYKFNISKDINQLIHSTFDNLTKKRS